MEEYLKLCYYPLVGGVPDSSCSEKPCLHTNSSFTVWNKGDFGLCFEYLVFSAFLGAVFGISSAFYAGIKHSKLKRKKKSLVLVVRGLLSLFILSAFLVDFIGSFWLSSGRPYSVLLSMVVLIVAWSLHVLYIWVLSCSVRHHGWGPLNMHAIWILLFVGNILHLRTTIRQRFHPAVYRRPPLPIEQAYFGGFSAIMVYVAFGLQCLYGLTIFGKVSRVTADNVSIYHADRNKGKTQWSDDPSSSVRQHLISSEWREDHVPTSYGSVPTSHSNGLTPSSDVGNLDASEDGSNPLSLLCFWWVGPLMKRGALGRLQKPEDLLQLPRSLKTSHLRQRFQASRGMMSSTTCGPEKTGMESAPHEVNISSDDGDESCESTKRLKIQGDTCDYMRIEGNESSDYVPRHESLFMSLTRTFGLHYYPLGVLKLIADMLGFAGPLLLHALVSFMEHGTEPMSHGYYYALGLFLSTLLGALLNTHFTYQVNKVSLKIRAALITEIYRKALSVNSSTLSKFSTGEIVNFMSTDSDRIVNFCNSFHQFWSLPFQVAVSLALLYEQVGLAFLGGLGFCILLIPVNRWLAVKIGKLSTAMMAQKDQRVKVMSEILAGIRVIKFYAWENNFIKKILLYRTAELKSLKGRKYLDALCVYFWASTPVLISIITFATYVAMGHALTAAKIFTSLALFNILISPLNAFPWVINGLMEAWVSTKRVNAFLQLKELSFLEYYGNNAADAQNRDTAAGSTAEVGQYDTDSISTQSSQQRTGASGTIGQSISIKHGTFTWANEDSTTDSQPEPSRQETVPPTQTTPHEDEESSDNNSSSPWSLRDVNISIQPGQFVGVVGKVGSGKSSLLMAITAEMKKVYGQVNIADLRDGFGLFMQESWIQHATLQDNILFGQPYDAHKYRTVIAATALEQDLQILPSGDKTEVGENGVTLSGGQKARVALARAIYQDKAVYLLDDPLAAVDAHVASHLYHHCINGLLRGKTRVLCTHHIRFLRDADVVVHMEGGKIHRCGSPAEVLDDLDVRDESKAPEQEVEQEPCEENSLDNTKENSSTDESTVQHTSVTVLVKEEEKAVGVVSISVYAAYWSAVGLVLAPLVLLALFLMQASRNVNDWWLTYWISESGSAASDNESSSSNLTFYLGIYGGLAAANSVFTLFRAFLYAYGGICAAKVLHQKLLSSILMAPTSFFDTTPIGRIVNRFSSDIYAIDDSLPFILNILLAQLYGLLGTLAITCYGLPWFTVLLLPLSLIYYNIQSYYRRTSRELKRLSTVTLSPIYAHFSETLTGLCTIRALRASRRFMSDNEEKLEVNQRANFGSYAVSMWLGIRLQMLGVAMVTGVAFIAVLEHHFNTVNPGLVGLAISYALSVTNLLSGVLTSFTETEKEMVSVERAMQYIKGVPKERRGGGHSPPPNWPVHGVLEFHNVVLTYREGLPSALKAVSFVTRPGEKIGVVGRTGAGKSSLFKALFRMVELSAGAISIDGINIATVPLEQLRSSLAIIPQDPFLFSGTVRDNLDPCAKHTDAELWSVLEQCHLKDAVRVIGGLESEVEEKGRVFSVGQRQLVCLARALLTQARVICIDEATASVDQQTDTMIQKTIKEEFTSSTVITIAHRIDTVLSSDRILVMEQGLVKEFAPPKELLENHDSLYYSLYKQHTTTTAATT